MDINYHHHKQHQQHPLSFQFQLEEETLELFANNIENTNQNACNDDHNRNCSIWNENLDIYTNTNNNLEKSCKDLDDMSNSEINANKQTERIIPSSNRNVERFRHQQQQQGHSENIDVPKSLSTFTSTSFLRRTTNEELELAIEKLNAEVDREIIMGDLCSDVDKNEEGTKVAVECSLSNPEGDASDPTKNKNQIEGRLYGCVHR